MSIDISSLVQIVLPIVVAILGALWVGFWKVNKNNQVEFRTLNKNTHDEFAFLNKVQQENHHSVDIRLTGIETTVSPYAQHISILQTQQSDNVVSITEMRGKVENMETSIGKLDRQVEELQKRK